MQRPHEHSGIAIPVVGQIDATTDLAADPLLLPPSFRFGMLTLPRLGPATVGIASPPPALADWPRWPIPIP